MYQCHPPYTRRVSSHRVLYLKFLSTYNMCIIYLLVIETCFQVTIAMFYFCHSKNPSDAIKNIFNSISINFWKKISFLTNIRNKGVIRKKNFYFLTSWKMAIFFLQKFVIFNMITDSFLIEKWGTLERQRGSSKNEESFGKSFSFPFSAKCFDRNIKYFLSWTFSFLDAMKFETLKQIEIYILNYFL